MRSLTPESDGPLGRRPASLRGHASPVEAAGYDLVIFDCDGVLVDSERLQVHIESRLLTELGWALAPAEVVRRWMGHTEAEMLADIATELGAAAAEDYHRRVSPEIEDAFGRELTEVAGISDLLDALDAAGVRNCVASSGSHERMAMTLGLTGLAERFAGRIFSALDVAHGKPAPDLFLHAAARMGVDPNRCSVIEDSASGVRAAVAAGMDVFGFAGGLAGRGPLVDAGAVPFDRMVDLLPGR